MTIALLLIIGAAAWFVTWCITDSLADARWWHGIWRPGHVLDPFAGSGTTLAVCTGMARDATGIDIDERNADLARERVGMFLDVDNPREVPA